MILKNVKHGRKKLQRSQSTNQEAENVCAYYPIQIWLVSLHRNIGCSAVSWIRGQQRERVQGKEGMGEIMEFLNRLDR